MGYSNKGRADHLVLGDHNAVCYVCGNKRKASQLKRHWRGYWVCPEHWEPRETQDFVKAVADNPTPPWIQDRPAMVAVAYCTPAGASAIVDLATPDCCVVDGGFSPMYDPTVTY